MTLAAVQSSVLTGKIGANVVIGKGGRDDADCLAACGLALE
jgi:hypothetical protein